MIHTVACLERDTFFEDQPIDNKKISTNTEDDGDDDDDDDGGGGGQMDSSGVN
jgi:hypothetical protein